MNGLSLRCIRRFWIIGTISDADEYQSSLIADAIVLREFSAKASM